MSLITSYFSPATPEEAIEQAQRGLEQIQQARQWTEARKTSKLAETTQRNRQLATQRQQRHRRHIKEAEVKQGLRDPRTLRKVKLMNLHDMSPDPTPILPTNNSVDSGSAAPAGKRRARRICWYEPVCWAIICTAAKRTGFLSPQAIVKEVQKGANGELFKSLDRGTMSRWINKERTGWTSEVLGRVARTASVNAACSAPIVAGAGRKMGPPARLDKYPSVRQSIVHLLTTMRNSGAIITRAVAQSITLAFIHTDAPELFHDPRFKCSESFIRRLLRNDLDWSWRTTTQAAQKLPGNWENLCVDLAHRLTWNIVLHKIPPELVINADQTGVSYLGTGRKTWDLKGAPQVPAVGREEKRQFTLMVAVTAAGEVLPFQAIYKGKTKNSLPSADAREPCKPAHFLFTPGGDKHWSNLESMQEWVVECLVDHAQQVRRRLGLPPTQKVIILIDCWSVHRGKPFREWLKTTYPWLILLFIPASCTSVAQPCDTRINRILKHLIKSECVEYLSQSTQAQLRSGVEPCDIEIDTTPGTLRNASAQWILAAWNWLKDHPEVVLDSWRQASFGEWNLSYECLTSAKSRAIVHERFAEDQEFALSIVQNTRQFPNDPTFEESDSTIYYDDDLAIDPGLLCDIRGSVGAQLPAQVVEREGELDYTGDENLSDGEEGSEGFE